MDEPTELTAKDIDEFFDKLKSETFDIKEIPCIRCGKAHFSNYGYRLGECDECFFSRLPKEEVNKFYRSFFE